MSTNCVIARRLLDGTVQFGSGGIGGGPDNAGERILDWYNEPKMVDYLFSLGQLGAIGKPGCYDRHSFWGCRLTGFPHWTSRTERCIFSTLPDIDFGYFYERDKRWYLIKNGQFIVKMPLELAVYNTREDGDGNAFFDDVNGLVLKHIFEDYPQTRPGFARLIGEEQNADVYEKLQTEQWPLTKLSEDYRDIYEYFDDWVVAVPDAAGQKIEKLFTRKKTMPNKETICWKKVKRYIKEREVRA